MERIESTPPLIDDQTALGRHAASTIAASYFHYAFADAAFRGGT